MNKNIILWFKFILLKQIQIIKKKLKVWININKNHSIKNLSNLIKEKLILLNVFIITNKLKKTKILDKNLIKKICKNFGHEVYDIKRLKDIIPKFPIITVLGHINHGKTSLLDNIIKKNFTINENGNITQSIRLHNIKYKGNKLNFLDTPGHNLFENIRNRGILIADIIILIISINEGIMSQTIECIKYVFKKKLPIIIVYNKIDYGIENISKIRNNLRKYSLLVEFMGGKINEIFISCKSKENIKLLLDTLIIILEINNLKCNINSNLLGLILDIETVKGLGTTSKTILKSGTLINNQLLNFDSGIHKIKSIINELNIQLNFVTPSYGFKLIGLPDYIKAGSEFKSLIKIKQFKNKNIKDSIRYKINVILKADSYNSLDTLIILFKKYDTKIIYSNIGDINTSNINLALSTESYIIGFNIKIPNSLKNFIQNNNINVINEKVIYTLINKIESLINLNNLKFSESKIEKIFYFKDNKIFGCNQISGSINIKSKIKVFRKKTFIKELKIKSLKILNQPVLKIKKNQQFGLIFKGDSSSIEIGDIIKSIEKK